MQWHMLCIACTGSSATAIQASVRAWLIALMGKNCSATSVQSNSMVSLALVSRFHFLATILHRLLVCIHTVKHNDIFILHWKASYKKIQKIILIMTKHLQVYIIFQNLQKKCEMLQNGKK